MARTTPTVEGRRDSSSPRTGRAAPLLVCLLVALAALSCAPAAVSTRSLAVAAASDLQFAFTEIGGLFEQETGARVTFTFGSSGNLAQQIENGMPVDLFASADEEYVQQLAARGAVIPDTERLYALGRIALVSSRASGVAVSGLEDLLKPEVKHVALANPGHAPYGRAAKQALENAGLWERVQPRAVYGENVRQALQFVQTGNAEAGIVALSIVDVPEVSHTLIEESLHQPLRQSMVVIKDTRQESLAREFQALVLGPKGQPIMQKYGFTLPGRAHAWR